MLGCYSYTYMHLLDIPIAYPAYNNYANYIGRSIHASWRSCISLLNVQNNTSVLKKKGNPDRKTFAMWKIARIGRGKHQKHQKVWEQEIRRVHNYNPLQRHNEHVYVLIHCISITRKKSVNCQLLHVARSMHASIGTPASMHHIIFHVTIMNGWTVYMPCRENSNTQHSDITLV